MKNLALAKLQALSLNATLAHAWLLCGELDQTLAFAQKFSQWLLCLNKPADIACGACKACHLFKAQTHPDFCSITAQDKSTIQIDAVRLIKDFTVTRPQISDSKIVLLYPAQAMPNQAANALLKSLEEPVGDTIYILLAKHHELLLKTVVSRCQILNFIENTAKTAIDHSITQQIAKDLLRLWVHKSVTTSQLVELWLKQWPKEVLYCFEIVITDVIRFKYTSDTNLAKSWCVEQSTLSTAISNHKIWTILERLRQAQYWLGQNNNPNMQLLIEDMLLV